MVEDVVVPIAGMIFVLCIVFGWRGFTTLDNYFRSKQSMSSDELMDIQDHLDELEDRMRVVESVMTDEKERGSPT